MLVFLNGESHPIGSIAGALVGLVIVGFVILMLLPDTHKVVGIGNEKDFTLEDWAGCIWLIVVLAAIVAIIALFLIAS